jgi:hypothetical protein
MKTKGRIALIILLAFAALVALEWKTWLEIRIRSELAARGFDQLAFSLDTVGPSGITFKDVSLPGALPLAIDKITIDYSLMELLHGQLRQLNIPDMKLSKDHKNIRVHNMKVTFLPAAGTDSWKGKWSTEKVEVEGIEVPPLSGAGNWASDKETKVDGEFKSADTSYRSSFTLVYASDAPDHSRLQVSEAQVPWNGGLMTARNVTVPLSSKRAITIPLNVQKISLDALMQAITGKRASATGTLSGTIPITVDADGNPTIGEGMLQTTAPGTLTLAPDVIPGDNAQVTMVRDILKNFHYDAFSMKIEQGKDKKLSILLSLSGNNPDVYNGKAVKLNVQLTGDLLNLIQQSLLPLENPKNYLKGDYEKH